MLDALRNRLFRMLALATTRCSWLVLGLSLATAAAAVAWTVKKLDFHSNRNDLIDEDLAWNKRYINWTKHFAGTADMWVVVDVGAAKPQAGADHHSEVEADYQERRRQAIQLVEELGPQFAESEHIEQVIWRFARSDFSPRAVRLQEISGFSSRLEDVVDSQPLLASRTPGAMLAAIASRLRELQNVDTSDGELTDAQVKKRMAPVRRLLDVFTARVSDDADPHTTLGDLMSGDEDKGYEYQESGNGRMFFIRITGKPDEGGINAMGPAIESIRNVLATTTPKYKDSGVEAGLTGIEVVEADETDAATVDSTIASIVAFVLIAAMLVLAFQSFKTPALAMAALLVGVAWSFGYTTVAIGYLQLISVVFAVMLLGLGIAFGIHLAARYELVRHSHPDTPEGCEDSIVDSLQVMGPGIITGAVTTAAAFCTTALTDFRGVAEMGIIAAGGVMLCLLAMFTTFPALLRRFKWRHRDVVPIRRRWVSFFEERWLSPFSRRPGITLGVAFGVFALSCLAMPPMAKFDFNLMNLQPRDVDSVQWQQRVTRDGGESIWTGTSICTDLDTARRRAQAFRALSTVAKGRSGVAGIGLLFPEDDDEKIAQLVAARAKIAASLEPALADIRRDDPDDITTSEQIDLFGQVAVLRLVLRGAVAGDIPEPFKRELGVIDESMQKLLAIGNRLSPDERAARLLRLQKEYAAWRAKSVRQIDQMFDTSPLTPQDVPDKLLKSYIGADEQGRTLYALEIAPFIDQAKYPDVHDPLNPAFLRDFIDALYSIDPGDEHVTGVIVQIFESGKLISESYFWAGIYALIAVFVLVIIDFRNILDALLSLVPIVVGFAVTFAVMWLCGMKINAANIIVLPLMFGIGVDAGVHIIHRYRMDRSTRPLGMTAGTGKAITITTFATMIGFGSMLLARHRGIASLGFVMTVGIGMTLLACWIVMPAALEIRQRWHERHGRG